MKKVKKMCQGSFNGVSESFKEVSKKFQECLKKVSRAFQYSFKSVFKEDFSGIKVI